jgi:hypothetical protein
MGQRPRGKDNQPHTDTALFGHIAYKLEEKNLKELESWAEELEIDVGPDGLRKARRQATRLRDRPGRRPALRDWLMVDWGELNFFVVSVRLRLEPRTAIDQLGEVPGVVDLYSLEEGTLAQLIAIYERRHDREALERKLEEFGRILAWEDVDSHHPEAAISTSRALSREAAAREGLRLPGS